MEEECYRNAGIKKIDAVKELFDNFASRSMAYDFHHIIGLVKFDSLVKTLHTFTENLEKFKASVHNPVHPAWHPILNAVYLNENVFNFRSTYGALSQSVALCSMMHYDVV